MMTFLIATCATGAGPELVSPWDAALPSLELENVHVQAPSIHMAWKRMATDYLLRTILYLPVETNRDPVPFSFSSQSCTAADVFNAFVATYPDMTWTQDKRTGVIWFHPRSIAYSTILTIKVRLGSDMLAVPMQTGVLEPLEQLDPFLLRIKRWGTGFTSTFNYAVNVPAGTYTVRDLLNTCCKTQISSTFYIRTYIRSSKNVESIMAISLYPDPGHDAKDQLDFPRPGAFLWWTMHLGPVNGDVPQREQVIDKISSPDRTIRSAARAYFAAVMWHHQDYDIERWMKETKGAERALWVCLAGTDIFVRTEGTTLTAAIKRMKKEATREFLMTADPGLALLTALELGRVAHDTRYLDVLSRRTFAPGDLSGVVADANRICRQSQQVRQKLTELGMDWLTSAEPKLAGLANAQPKCEFERVEQSPPAPTNRPAGDK